ncbi:hypothetical protein T4B_4314 [Trichinella pseudospiralis]|uniref:Uncharacterized protein n=1 Tax=Trichinella pseudospiralis TaxID=6337 RepID=A0A0V1IQD3_TRIPS|nr:hypothetical protein T4B_4314 [Trichinella pseudospiralis]
MLVKLLLRNSAVKVLKERESRNMLKQRYNKAALCGDVLSGVCLYDVAKGDRTSNHGLYCL